MMTPILQSVMRKLTPTQLQPVSIEEIYPVLQNQRDRNEKRMKQIIEDMGSTWILHKDHMKKKLKVKRPV